MEIEVVGDKINIKAGDGKLLTNGETYGTYICLGVCDTVEHWKEIDKSEYQPDKEEPKN